MRTRAALFLCLLAGTAQASPTANEYEPCHKLGAYYLQTCLDRAAGQQQPQCWTEAHTAVDRCYTEVRASHDKGRIEEKRRAAQQR